MEEEGFGGKGSQGEERRFTDIHWTTFVSMLYSLGYTCKHIIYIGLADIRLALHLSTFTCIHLGLTYINQMEWLMRRGREGFWVNWEEVGVGWGVERLRKGWLGRDGEEMGERASGEGEREFGGTVWWGV